MLLDDQIEAWKHLWRQFDLALDTREQNNRIRPSLVLHLHCFHALQSASPHSSDIDAGIPARGLTGEGYQGHVFWDDLFIFPFLNFRMPQITQSLLKYRYRRLAEARKLARADGARGARFPWQSASSGNEETPIHFWDENKKIWRPEHTQMQLHVNAAIAFNLWQYYQVTEDLAFMHSYGAEIFFDIARFFASYAKYCHMKDRYEIHRTVGPDEYHSAYPGSSEDGINNNAYTNVMASWVLARALDLISILPSDLRQEIRERLNLSKKEIKLWNEISRKIFVPFMENGIISQFEGYEKLEEFPCYDNDGIDYEYLDKILEEQGGKLNQYKISKQADVLMLFYLFSAEELYEIFERLNYKFDSANIKANIEYYMPRTANNSTLSRVAHAWVLSRLNRKKSWKLLSSLSPSRNCKNGNGEVVSLPHSWDVFLEALASDLFDIQGGSTAEGVHLGAMAGTIDIIQRCYTGLESRKDVLIFNPQLPHPLTHLSFIIHYRNQSLAVDITQHTARVTAKHSSAKSIKIGFKHDIFELAAGESLFFKLRKSNGDSHDEAGDSDSDSDSDPEFSDESNGEASAN